MSMVRKLITVGNSRAITIPEVWLKYQEDKLGHKLESLVMDVDNKITLRIERPGYATKRELGIWALAVLTRDNFTCQKCGKEGARKKKMGGYGVLAHHIIERHIRPDLVLDVDNGKTLCRSCHSKLHIHGEINGR